MKSRFDIKLSQRLFQCWHTGKILKNYSSKVKNYVFPIKDRSSENNPKDRNYGLTVESHETLKLES